MSEMQKSESTYMVNFKFINLIFLSFFLIFISSCSRSFEGDIEYGLDLVKDMEFALKLAKDQNPTYAKKMKKAENEIYEFLAEMREKYSQEEYQKIDSRLQKEMDNVLRRAMQGY
jgi:hypothetical protein